MNTPAENSLFYMLHDVTRQIRKHFDRRATRLELTRAQWRALKVTSRHEGLSQSELAEHLDDALRGIDKNDLDTLMSVLNSIKENLATLDAPQDEERKVS